MSDLTPAEREARDDARERFSVNINHPDAVMQFPPTTPEEGFHQGWAECAAWCEDRIRVLEEALRAVERNDKTVYDYSRGPRAVNRNGLPPDQGRWLTPREIARDALSTSVGSRGASMPQSDRKRCWPWSHMWMWLPVEACMIQQGVCERCGRETRRLIHVPE